MAVFGVKIVTTCHSAPYVILKISEQKILGRKLAKKIRKKIGKKIGKKIRKKMGKKLGEKKIQKSWGQEAIFVSGCKYLK